MLECKEAAYAATVPPRLSPSDDGPLSVPRLVHDAAHESREVQEGLHFGGQVVNVIHQSVVHDGGRCSVTGK